MSLNKGMRINIKNRKPKIKYDIIAAARTIIITNKITIALPNHCLLLFALDISLIYCNFLFLFHLFPITEKIFYATVTL